ncbi:MAG: hypothetical protein ACE5LC_10900 [Candidatus Aminicenantales bacterium]
MRKKKAFIDSGIVVLALFLIIAGLSQCRTPQLKSTSWTIKANPGKGLLEFSHRKLGIVLKNVKLCLKDKKGISPLTGWKTELSAQTLTIFTRKPEKTTWTFKTKEGALIISSTSAQGFLQAKAPAAERRIPARTEDEDNGIMYTSLGYISSNNIYCLFDRETNFLIQFPKKSTLLRSSGDETLMEVSFPVKRECRISLIPNYYLKVLGLKYYKPKPKRFERAPTGWCSWYCYYMGATEADLVRETDALAKHLKPYGLEIVQLDACYTKGEKANYLQWYKEAWPQGGKWLFEYIRSKGLKPGLWINVYGSNYARAECAEKYPENFYLRDKEGKISSACCTADETVVRLDYSNPEVIEKHLKPMFTILKEDWGLAYLKDAGWGTWIDYFDRNRERAFDPSKTGRELYVEVQKALRETLGDETYILGCAMHEVGLCFGIFDGSRIGGDDRAVWYPEEKNRMSMQTFFHSLFGGNYLNNIVWHSDPDTVMVRQPLTLEEARTVVTSIALTGQVYMASDFMDRLPKNRMELYQKTMPTTPVVPVDLYPYRIESNKREGIVWCCPRVKEFPRAIDLKVNGVLGKYDVLAVFNWEDEAGLKTISLENDLGLSRGKHYIAFDFWKQEPQEVVRGKISCQVPAHGTRVFVVKSASPVPEVVATSRHITSTISIKDVEWDEKNSLLRGTSEVVPSTHYSLFIHVPAGMEVTGVSANAEVLFYNMLGRILEVKFSTLPQSEKNNILEWTVHF